jgi:ACS family hexuronate transporter-like MFS transporter
MVGATLAPPLIGGLAIAYGWRAAFLATGLVGLIWMSVWLRLHPLEARPARLAGARGEASLWMELLRDRPLWLLTLARGLTDPVWYFYLFWFPKYLNDERGMTLAAVASLAWIVYLAADLGSIGGGLLSSALVRRGVMPPRSRLLVMTGAAIVGPVSLFAAFHPALLVLFVIAGAVALAHMVFLINISTLVVDLYPTRAVATVFGIFGAGSGLGGMLSTQVVGHLVASGRFDHCFMLMAALHPLALGLVWLALRMAPGSRLVAKTAGLQVTSSA